MWIVVTLLHERLQRRLPVALLVIGAMVIAATLTLNLPALSVVDARAAPMQDTLQISAEERRLILAATGASGVNFAGLDDAALVRELIAYARREMGLRIRPPSVDGLWSLSPPARNPEVEFRAARADGSLGNWLAQIPPRHPQYVALRATADQYRAATLAPFVPIGLLPTLREGDAHEALPAVHARLADQGFPAPPATAPTFFDAGLKAALEAFQARRGLAVDGVLGPATRAALDVSPSARLTQIEANLERLRWLPRDLPADRVEVNIAAAEAALIQAGRPVLRMRIVVGDLSHKTPMFASRLEAVVFNPPWNVPASIANNEILPRAARDPGYLARNNFVRIDGRLRQRPGPNNSLGQIKFDLPSPFGVYLHDTPGKAAFQRPMRTLSHGCMRLEKPRELALALLTPQGWREADVTAAIAAGGTHRVNLDRPVPLYVVYQTAMVEDGRVRFVPDVYGWDAKLTAALTGARAYAARAATDTDCAEAQRSAGWDVEMARPESSRPAPSAIRKAIGPRLGRPNS